MAAAALSDDLSWAVQFCTSEMVLYLLRGYRARSLQEGSLSVTPIGGREELPVPENPVKCRSVAGEGDCEGPGLICISFVMFF